MLEFISSVWWMIVTLGILVTFHEYGHYWVAKKFGVKILKFSIGYGKFFWSRKDKHGTEFGVAPIPLGGYVKLLDTRDPDVIVTEADKNLTYNSKPIWQKALIMFAGPGFNFILAVLMFWVMFVYGKNEIHPTIGEPQKIMLQAGALEKDQIFELNGYEVKTWQDVSLELITNGLDRQDISMKVKRDDGHIYDLQLPLSKLPDDVEETEMFENIGISPWRVPISNRVDGVAENKPAEIAGIKAGDVILEINGEETPDWYAVVEKINKYIKGELNLLILRNGNTFNVTISQSVFDEIDKNRRIIGISSEQTDEKSREFYRSLVFSNSYGLLDAVPAAFNETWRMITVSVEMMGKIVTGKASLKNLSGPITIAQVANDSASRGVAWFLGFLGLVSLSLGIINLLPIPMLDGGQLVFLLFEKIKGAPLSEEFQLKGQTIGIIFLLCFMSIAFYNDILRLVT
ncbi:MAG TPA: RIP metalloprotease RseP [Gammaproteobacteria bacterium]|nr:RIP metalloprotease RseP [Xanthomonadales bacterium]MCB1594072.1 RIP metalloprotease RseP [Xanthomonadales bacterium]HOP22552.1 RIP metalloprotease RseP [Gammaproteobacteria bacterium]HPI95975.1 RIP metalloprotease RseP [Gammaproteobacteria bacterium]HPQ87429.1 RIP metalloprotease RseP [Gammaproteobacteria bacterium]